MWWCTCGELLEGMNVAEIETHMEKHKGSYGNFEVVPVILRPAGNTAEGRLYEMVEGNA